jgi:hypothetical protein
MDLNQPVTFFVLGALGLVSLGIGLVSLVVSGTTKTVLNRVSDGSLLLLALVSLVIGCYQVAHGERMVAKSFFIISITLFVVGWFFFSLAPSDEKDLW